MSTIFPGFAAIILYGWAGFRLGARLYRRETGPANKSAVLAVALVAVLLHAAILYMDLIHPQGLNLSFFNAASLFTWLIALIIAIAAITKPVENLGILIFPTAAVGAALQLITPADTAVLEPYGPGLDIHILTSVVAYSILSIAAVQAALLAIQDQHLRNRHPGGFIRALPPLETMETLLFQMIGLGFIVQTLSLASGAIYLEDLFAQHLVHKTVLSILAWLVFGTLLFGRWRFGWRGRTAIRWTLSGFVVLVLAYFGSKLVLELVLGR